MSSRRAAAAALAGLLTAVAACASDGGRDGPPATSGPATTGPATTVAVSAEGLSATLDRHREDDSTGVVQLQVTNRSGATVVLDQVRLRWAGFTEQPARSHAVQLAPDQTVDIPVPSGTAVCGPSPRFDVAAPSAPAEASATAAFAGAVPVPVTIPVTDRRGVLARLYVPACQEAALAATATLSFGPQWLDTTLDGRPAATGVLRLRRSASVGPDAAAVRVVEVGGTVLLRIEPLEPPAPGEPWLTLAPNDGEAERPVALVQSGDCRPHALAESKHTFFLRATVAVEGGPTLVVYVRPDTDDEAQLLALINRACGVG